MVYVGIDLHRNRSQIAVLNEQGAELVSRRIGNDPGAFLELLQEIGDDAKIALEATYGWEWLADLLEGAGYELHLAHPLRTKAIAAARVKTELSTRGRSRICSAPTCCRRRTLPRASCATCVICSATGSRSPACARR